MIVDCDALSEVLVSLNKKLLDAMQKFILLALTLSFIEKHIQGGISHSNYDLRRPPGARCVKDGQLREGETKIR